MQRFFNPALILAFSRRRDHIFTSFALILFGVDSDRCWGSDSEEAPEAGSSSSISSSGLRWNSISTRASESDSSIPVKMRRKPRNPGVVVCEQRANGGKVASSGTVWTLFSAVELVICSKPKNFHSLRTTYSRLDKLSPDDQTLPHVALPAVRLRVS